MCCKHMPRPFLFPLSILRIYANVHPYRVVSSWVSPQHLDEPLMVFLVDDDPVLPAGGTECLALAVALRLLVPSQAVAFRLAYQPLPPRGLNVHTGFDGENRSALAVEWLAKNPENRFVGPKSFRLLDDPHGWFPRFMI